MRGPVLAGLPLQPGAVGPGDIEVGAVVLVERLLHHVVQAPRSLEATDPQAPRRLGRAVLQVRLVDRALAVLQAGRPRCVGTHPELLVVLVGVQPCGHPAAEVPAAAQVAAQPQARAGAQAVGIGLGAAAGAGFGGDIAEADIAAGLPVVVGVDAARHQCKGDGGDEARIRKGNWPRRARDEADTHSGLHAGGRRAGRIRKPGSQRRLCARVAAHVLTWINGHAARDSVFNPARRCFPVRQAGPSCPWSRGGPRG